MLEYAMLCRLVFCRKKQLLTDEKAKKTLTDIVKTPTTLEKVETVGRAVLAYNTTETYSNKLQVGPIKSFYALNIILSRHL